MEQSIAEIFNKHIYHKILPAVFEKRFVPRKGYFFMILVLFGGCGIVATGL